MDVKIWSKKNALLIWIIFIFCLTIYVRFNHTQFGDKSVEGHFWVLSDAHVDMQYRADGDPASRCRNQTLNNLKKVLRKFGHFQCDTPIELLISAISAAKRLDSNVDFVIWLGDSTNHRSPDENTTISINLNFTQELRKYFPQTLIIPVLGNHDIIFTQNNSERFANFYFKTKYDLLLTDDHARQTFLRGGYYSLRHQTYKKTNRLTLRFVVLNTAMFQPQYSSYFNSNEPMEQIDWFNRTMSRSVELHEQILLLAHTPFGINENLLYRFYDMKYEQKILSIIDQYSSNIIMCLSGHRHQDSFRLYSSSKGKLGLLGHPPISPISYLSQPSIRKYSYNRQSLVLNDYEQYILNIIDAERTQTDKWTFSYRFSSWYHQSKQITSQSLYHLINLIRTNSFYLKRFLLAKHSTDRTVLTNHKIIQTTCALTLLNFDEFIFCTRLLEKNNYSFFNLTINKSLEMNLLLNEQLIEYRLIYRRTIVCLFIVLFLCFSIIYWLFRKYFDN